MSNFRTTLNRIYQSERMQGLLTRCSLSDPQNQQIAAILMAVVMGLTLIGSIGYSWAKAVLKADTASAGPSLPADINDATAVCNTEMEQRLGDQLLRSYVDQHSTRLDNRKGQFRVYIKADVGDIRDFREIDVYCFVDKWDHSVSHYKEIDPTVKRVMTSDLKFFKD